MAIGGKTLGIVSGLAVGLTSGVILAALNPIVPKTGTPVGVETAMQPDQSGSKTDPALPKLSMVETSPESSSTPSQNELSESKPTEVADVDPVELQQPSVQTNPEDTNVAVVDAPTLETSEPVLDVQDTSTVDTSKPPETFVAEVLEPGVDPVTKLALVLPESTAALSNDDSPNPPTSVAGDAQPKVSSEPAQAIALAEPKLQTESPTVTVSEPVLTQTVETAVVAQPEATDEPTEIAASETSVAALPEIQQPDAIEPELALVQEPIQDDEPNTSGTFKTSGGSLITQGASLPKIGDSQNNSLASLGTGTSTSRFKTIGDSSKITDTETETAGITEPDVGALVRNANDFPVTDDPLMSIILIDDGKIATQLDGLQGLNLPLTIAISLDDADAGERARRYRDAGFEVLAMTPRNVKLSLSGGQTPEQVATLLDTYFEIMPQSVGLIDRPSANMQKDQRLSRAVVQHLAQTGHGLVTYAGGLNSTKRIADQENVSNATVFNFLDASGESGQILNQKLDRAAREARSKGAVILMVTPSKTTLGTLVSWSLSTKARAVTFAPVSASLLRN